MITTPYIDEYKRQYEAGEIKLNKDRRDLLLYLDRSVLNRDDLYFDEEQLENYIAFAEKWYFPLRDFQKFIASFFFLFHTENDRPFYRKFLIMMGRGGGKNGLVTTLINFFASELHGIRNYNVSLVANSEDQAKVSFKEMYDTIKREETLQEYYRLTKLEIEDRKTGSVVKFRTSNASTKDGLRDGCVIYDEIHQYENNNVVRVFSSGLGKIQNPREIFIGTDGYVREGFLDKMKDTAKATLSGEADPATIFAFICKLDDPDEVKDEDLWEKANPMFCKPISLYGDNLLYTVRQEYRDLTDDPSGREEFMTKRMNLPEEDQEKSVAPWEQILATNKPIDEQDLLGRTAVGGLDFASIRDFAAVGLLFKVDGEYIWKSHSFVRKGFLDKFNLKAPIKEWQEAGLLTIVDEPIIDIKHIVDYFVEMREKYNLTTIAADTFRLDLVKTALEAEGFELFYIRNPRAIHAKLAPRVETIFAQKNLNFGDNPLMRWYTNNVYVRIKGDGNKEYLKKDDIRRKTDGFQAFIHALWQADDILEEEEIDYALLEIDF